MALGEQHSAAGDEAGADQIYEELVSSGHANMELYDRWMLAAMEAGEYETALEHAEAGLLLEADEARKSLKFNEAVCYEYLGQ